mgnify:CR=1 FL=1
MASKETAAPICETTPCNRPAAHPIFWTGPRRIGARSQQGNRLERPATATSTPQQGRPPRPCRPESPALQWVLPATPAPRVIQAPRSNYVREKCSSWLLCCRPPGTSPAGELRPCDMTTSIGGDDRTFSRPRTGDRTRSHAQKKSPFQAFVN